MTDIAVNPRPLSSASPLHSGIRVPMFLALLIVATMFPLLAGFAVYGWRAIGTVAAVVGSATGAMAVLQRVGWRGRQVRMWHCFWLSLIVSLMLPAHLLTTAQVGGQIVWPI